MCAALPRVTDRPTRWQPSRRAHPHRPPSGSRTSQRHQQARSRSAGGCRGGVGGVSDHIVKRGGRLFFLSKRTHRTRWLRGCSLWKLACERSRTQHHQHSRIANPLNKGVSGDAACGSWPARDRPIRTVSPFCLHSSHASSSAAHSTGTRAARDRPSARPARRARRCTRGICV